MQESTSVPGHRIRLCVPPGFVPSTRFAGFENPSEVAFLLVTDLPGVALEAVVAGGAQQGHRLLPAHLVVQDAQQVEVDGVRSLLLTAVDDSEVERSHKQLLVTGDPRGAVLVVGAYPGTAPHRLRVQVREALLSLRWAHPEAAFGRLRFRLDLPEGFAEAGRMAGTCSFVEIGPAAEEASRALLVFGAGVPAVEPSRLEAFARERASSTATLEAIDVLGGAPFSAAGQPGYELTADARDSESGAALHLYQAVVLAPDGYAVLVGMVDAERAEAFVPGFRQAARTIRVAETSGGERP